jgi:hypothetical protein
LLPPSTEVAEATAAEGEALVAAEAMAAVGEAVEVVVARVELAGELVVVGDQVGRALAKCTE